MSDTFTLDVEIADEMPKAERGPGGSRSGKYADMLRPAMEDGKVRKVNFPPEVTEEEVKSFRTALQHSANALGTGLRTVVKKEDNGTTSVWFQTKKKRATVAASGQSTPDDGTPAPATAAESGGAAPASGAKKAAGRK